MFAVVVVVASGSDCFKYGLGRNIYQHFFVRYFVDEKLCYEVYALVFIYISIKKHQPSHD